MNPYMPWVWNCSTAYVPRSWISSDVLSQAPLKCIRCVCESGPVHTWHSERTQCSGWLSQVKCPRLMERRSPVRTVPVKERKQTMTYKEQNLLHTNGTEEWCNDFNHTIAGICSQSNEMKTYKQYIINMLSYLIHIRDALWNIVLCAKGTNDTVGVLGQGQKWVEWCDIVRSRGRHCKVWYAGNLTVSWNS